MSRIILPELKVKARRRRRRARMALLFGILALGIFGGAVALARASFLRITDVAVSGVKTVPQISVEEIVREKLQGSYFFLFPKNNILLYPQKEIEKTLLAAHGEFKTAEVRAKDFHALAVAVIEREPKAVWCYSITSGQAECYLMDEDGVPYAPAPQFAEQVYVEYRGTLGGYFSALFALVEALMQKEPDNPVRQVVVDENEVRAYFQKDFLLIFSLKDSGGDVFERFSLALASEPFKGRKLSEFEYLDLRFGDKLYYKIK
ncbi:hypothetical protein A2852_00405 [Candidatus Adlerbacteria bacterium RIFCSPHIGHO2_01_FULL_54_23]|uniref:POTRA domain-containing protein n=3 Tax=Candidatus Adleribacteriota TaxID=1752736 RepID=A0A1F4XZB2_9BACT|nr:MAG: hypothetical protein UY83_C0004G0028 [Candidatus Adlerbacteria bacterium GW2011_GWA1_54_10]OGC78664.1 MAG: hypothetical protein A2852_00405 [Candidatus Adlerbacteria bacterium RIFCSPHIGHO2_01_FULL_54_23]OGC86984.1 MAG: hypothetical protein A3B33_03290 [Candidatus Adlerbacteria bacterium RIFCSPLOWO2_01_FULL_54_16]